MHVLAQGPLLLADEVFLVVADLHRNNPSTRDFSVREILEHAHALALAEERRSGFAIHVRQHCVANLPPNPGKYRILFASGKARRRLLNPNDPVAPGRTGKIFPGLAEIDPRYAEVVEWARKRFEDLRADDSVYKRLIHLRGSGKGLWTEGADAFVAELRKDWQ